MLTSFNDRSIWVTIGPHPIDELPVHSSLRAGAALLVVIEIVASRGVVEHTPSPPTRIVSVVPLAVGWVDATSGLSGILVPCCHVCAHGGLAGDRAARNVGEPRQTRTDDAPSAFTLEVVVGGGVYILRVCESI